MTERLVQLALSPKAAAVLDRAIEHGISEEFHFDDENSDILVAIRRDIRDQLPHKGKSKKSKRAQA